MHFYTEHTNFGEETGRFSDGGENSFLVTSQFCLNDDMNAFACQRGIIIVLPCDNDCETGEDDELVTVILKPTDHLEINFRNVDYYVYRGILKSSILKSDTEIQMPNEKSTEWIDHIFRGRENHEAFPACFVGYSKDYADDTTIDFVFSESNGMAVSEGEWFGIFSKEAGMGFEIVTDSKMFPLTVGYAKQGCYSVKPSGTTDFERRMSRERILAFIDPVAFWGMHSEVGIHVVGQTQKLKGEELRTSILSLYGNKNRVYMDIRSEWGYSYNVYGNYSDASENSIQLCTGQDNIIARRYETNGWPILYFDMEQNLNENFDHVTINLRINDNTKPILFVENAEFLGKNNFSHFLDEKVLLNGAATDWSNDVVLKFPDSNWTYIKLQYFKQNNVANAVYSTDEMDTLQIFNISFASLDTKNLGNAAYIFSQAEDNNSPFIEGVLSNEKSFSGVAVAGANFDTKRVVFHTQMVYIHKTTGDFYISTNIKDGFDLEGSFNQMSFLKKNINCFAQSILENGASEPIKLLDISAYNGFPNRKEDLFVLGLTQDELFALKNVSGLSPLHSRYIGFDDVSPTPSKDVMGTYYRKYKLKVWGYDCNGECMETYPSSDIFVYTKSGHVFTSKEFSKLETNVNDNEKYIYYTKEGFYLGGSADSKKVYIVTQQEYEMALQTGYWFVINKTGNLLKENKLPIQYSRFEYKSSTVYGESSVGYNIVDRYEMYAIASALERNSNAYGDRSEEAKIFRKTSPIDRNKYNKMKFSIAAEINALIGGIDYSNGAKQWDGVEQSHLPPENPNATNEGGTQYKINVMGWTISDEHYNSWKNAITKKFGSNYFNVPQKKYAVANYGGMKNKDKIRLSSVAQYGLTIFWKEVNIQKPEE